VEANLLWFSLAAILFGLGWRLPFCMEARASNAVAFFLILCWSSLGFSGLCVAA
jgi:hypothetical protein